MIHGVDDSMTFYGDDDVCGALNGYLEHQRFPRLLRQFSEIGETTTIREGLIFHVETFRGQITFPLGKP